MFIGEGEDVIGVTWLENKIYTVSDRSSMVRIFQDHEPFNEEIPIEVKDMKIPNDMVASKVNRAIFISDWEKDDDKEEEEEEEKKEEEEEEKEDQKEEETEEEDDNESGCVWMIQIPDRKIIRCDIEGRPWWLSITPSNDLLVTSQRRGMDYPTFLNSYKLPEVEWLKTIHMPTQIVCVSHAVQTTNGNFIISCSHKNSHGYVISELSTDGTHINQTFDLQSVDSILLKTWKPVHLAIDEDGNIFVADMSDDGHRVFQLSSRLNRIEMELNHDRHQIDQPFRLCYVREKHMLIVGQESLSTGGGSFCAFEFL